MNDEIRIQLIADIATFQNNMNQVSNDVSSFGNKLGGIMKKVGALAVAGTAVAGAALVGFGKEAVQAAAEMQATNAQFDQVFGNMGAEATKTLQAMGAEFGMMPERLKGPLSMTTSMFKGLGLSTEEALTKAAAATTIAADAAAFYDKSYEDANAALNSFIKGNYEGGEAIGLFANETQISKWAADELGLSWKTLDEAGKQIARLTFAETMQAAAGATGQAARESDSLVNQQANLTAEWTKLLAKMGEPILPMVIDWIKDLSAKVSAVDTDALIQGFKDYYERGKEAVVMMKDFVVKWSPLLAGILAGTIAFKAITAGIVAYNAILKAYQTVALLATTGQLGLNVAMKANPVGAVVTVIGLLVAAGVLLYKNWDVVKAKLNELWTAFKTKFNDIKNAVTTKMNEIKTTITTLWNGVMTFFKGINLKDIGTNIIAGLVKGISNKFGDVKAKIRELANLIPDGLKKMLGIHSPAKVTEEDGKWTTLGFVKGITGEFGTVTKAAQDLGKLAHAGIALAAPKDKSSKTTKQRAKRLLAVLAKTVSPKFRLNEVTV